MTITLYGIKNCDTVKKARDWLTAQHVEYQFHDFRTDGLSKQQVEQWIRDIGLETLVNKRSTTWKALDDAIKAHFDEQSAARIIVENPTLIKRPVLDTGTQLKAGFNAADYVHIFN